MTEQAGGATSKQVAAIARARLGWEVGAKRVHTVAKWLMSRGFMRDRGKSEVTDYTPDEADLVIGELWRRRPGWTLRGDVADRLFPAWVSAEAGSGEGGEGRVMLLPERRDWDPAMGDWRYTVPDVIERYVYPTAEPCGRLLWEGEYRDGLPVYGIDRNGPYFDRGGQEGPEVASDKGGTP